MRNIKKKFLVGLLFSSLFVVHAQSNLTDYLKIKPQYDHIGNLCGQKSCGGNNSFESIREKLYMKDADCFLLTTSFDASDNDLFPSDILNAVFTFKIDNQYVFEIAIRKVENDFYPSFRWYIIRYLEKNNVEKKITYFLYDQLPGKGNFTFIIGNYITVIAVDRGDSFEMSPVFFGMDSNLDYLGFDYHMDAFTGKAFQDEGFDREIPIGVYSLFETNVYKMHGKNNKHTIKEVLKYLTEFVRSDDNSTLHDEKGSILKNKSKFVAENEEQDIIDSFKLYPNPTNTNAFSMTVYSEEKRDAVVKVTDVYGKTCYEQYLQIEEGTQTLDIAIETQLNPGMYFVSFNSQEQTAQEILVVE